MAREELAEFEEEEQVSTLRVRRSEKTHAHNTEEKVEEGFENESKEEKQQHMLHTSGNLVFYDRIQEKTVPDSGIEGPEAKAAAVDSEIVHHGDDRQLINEFLDDEIDYDLENVIQKQKSHDLYCPNCNSCITRRVILRRRKRSDSPRVSDQEAKRNKTTTKLGGGGLSDHDVHEKDEAHSDEEQPDIFRCLSCFSFFLPNGRVFKLKIFGRGNETEVVQEKQPSGISKGWFGSPFVSTEKGINIQKDASADSTQRAGVDNGTGQYDGKESKSDNLPTPDSGSVSIPHHLGGSKDSVMIINIDHEKPLLQSPRSLGINIQKDASADSTQRAGVDNGTGQYDGKESKSDNLPTPDSGSVSIPHHLGGSKASVMIINIDHEKPLLQSPLGGGITPAETITMPLLESTTQTAATGSSRIEVIKSIVYGGLTESVTSLSIISSAAGGGASTLNVLALGAANLIGGLIILFHSLWELKNDLPEEELVIQISDQTAANGKDRYKELLGQRKNFAIHFTVSLLSFIVFGLVPLVAYGFSFRESDDRELKVVVTGSVSLVCILLLSIAHAYVMPPPKPYFNSISTFVVLGFAVSGISYGAGVLFQRLIDGLGLFPPAADVPSPARLMIAAW